MKIVLKGWCGFPEQGSRQIDDSCGAGDNNNVKRYFTQLHACRPKHLDFRLSLIARKL